MFFQKKANKKLTVENLSLFLFELMLYMNDDNFRTNFLKRIHTYRPYEVVEMLNLKIGDLQYQYESSINEKDNLNVKDIVRKCIVNFEQYMTEYFEHKTKVKIS